MSQNPFHPLAPPDDPSLFYGRANAIAFLRQRLVGANNQELIVILGRLGMGKTSLLLQIPYLIDERYEAVYINIGNLDSLRLILSKVTEAIVAHMEVIGASTYRVPEFPEDEDADLRAWFADDFLDVVLTAIRRDRFLLLMLDDFDSLYGEMETGNLPADFIHYWGGLLHQHERLDVVAAVDIRAEDETFQYPATASVHNHHRLSHIEIEAARQLITEPVAEKYTYHPEAIDRILDLCGGFPFLLHSLCRLIYRQELSIIGLDDVARVYPAALEETGEVTDGIWEYLAPNTQLVTLAVLQMDYKTGVTLEALEEWRSESPAIINKTQLGSKLRTLEYLDILHVDAEGHYTVHTELEADWILANKKRPMPTQQSVNRARMAGVIGIVVVIAIVLAVALLSSSGSSNTNDDAIPSTLTLDVNVEATRQASEP